MRSDTDVFIFVCIYTQTEVPICVYMHIYVCMNTYLYAYVSASVYTYMLLYQLRFENRHVMDKLITIKYDEE